VAHASEPTRVWHLHSFPAVRGMVDCSVPQRTAASQSTDELVAAVTVGVAVAVRRAHAVVVAK
jgi:hypothetical protein